MVIKQPQKIYNHHQTSLFTTDFTTATLTFHSNLWKITTNKQSYLNVLRPHRLNFKVYSHLHRSTTSLYCTCTLKLRCTHVKPLEGKSSDLHLRSSPLPKYHPERLQWSMGPHHNSPFQTLLIRTKFLSKIFVKMLGIYLDVPGMLFKVGLHVRDHIKITE